MPAGYALCRLTVLTDEMFKYFDMQLSDIITTRVFGKDLESAVPMAL